MTEEEFNKILDTNPTAIRLLAEFERVSDEVIAEVDKVDPDGPWQDDFDNRCLFDGNAEAWAGHYLDLYGKDALAEWRYAYEPYRGEEVFVRGDELLVSIRGEPED